MENKMITFSIGAICSYTWNKNIINNKSKIKNILDCMKTLTFAIFNYRQINVSEVEIIYTLANKDTLFSKEYSVYLNHRKIESQSHAINYDSDSNTENKMMHPQKTIVKTATDDKSLQEVQIENRNVPTSDVIHSDNDSNTENETMSPKKTIVKTATYTKSFQEVQIENRNASINAAKTGDMQLMTTLIQEKQYCPNALDEDNNNPLHCAIAHGHLNIVQYLLENDNSENAYVIHEKNGQTAFHIAAQHGQLEIIKYLIDNQPKNTGDPSSNWCNNSWTNKSGATPFFVAATNGHLEMITYLITAYQQLDVNKTATDRFQCILSETSKNGHLDVVNFLVNHGAKIDGVSLLSPLAHAIINGHYKVVEYLLENNARIEEPCKTSGAILHINFAIEQLFNKPAKDHSFEIFKKLLEKTPKNKLNLWDWNNTSALNRASSIGHLDAVKYLVNKGADINLKPMNKYHSPPLHLAVRHNHHEVVNFLLQHGANVNFIDPKGKTPLDIAKEVELDTSKPMMKLLTEHGAN